jgi:hypothetical protein
MSNNFHSRIGKDEALCSDIVLKKCVGILLNFGNKSSMALEFLSYISFIFEYHTTYTEQNMAKLVSLYHQITNSNKQISYIEYKQEHYDFVELHGTGYLNQLRNELTEFDSHLSNHNHHTLAILINILVIRKDDYLLLISENNDIVTQTIVWRKVFTSLNIYTQEFMSQDNMNSIFNVGYDA